MIPINDFLSMLHRLGVKLWDDEGYLGYSAPEGVLTEALMGQLRLRKAEILAVLRQGQRQSARPPLQPRPQDDHYHGPHPLSFAQQRLWFMDQMGTGSVYNSALAWRLFGPLQIAALEQALTALVARHEILRTNLITGDGAGYQVIRPPETVACSVVDLQMLPLAEHTARLKTVLNDRANQPFDLAHDPMLRATVIRLAEHEAVLLLVMHHIAVDGWSQQIFNQELAACYASFLQGKQPALPALPLQYADFALWQRGWLQGDALEGQLNYWLETLAEAPPLLEIPTDRPRPAQQSYRGGKVDLEIDSGVSTALQALSQQAGVTLYVTLLAALNVLFGKYSHQEKIVVGAHFANRTEPALEALIGFFVNSLPICTDLTGNPTFIDLLNQVQERIQSGYDHQDLPFADLVQALQPERTLSHSPIFQASFSLAHEDRSPLTLAGLEVKPEALDVQLIRFDLTIELIEEPGSIHGIWMYNADLFDETTIQRMSQRYQTLLAALVANPRCPIADLSLLTAAERRQLLVDWNATAAAYPADQCIHQLFEAQAERCPDAIALRFEAQEVSYRELNAKANRVAHHLQAAGIGPEHFVGLYGARSVDLMIGLLGILKAGAAYVPINLHTPPERVAQIVAQTALRIIVASQRAQALPGLPDVETVYVDALAAAPTLAVTNWSSPVQPHNPAYLLFTSGSTGVPKGVIVEHRQLVNYTLAVRDALRLADLPAAYNFATVTNLAADLGNTALFPTWALGGAVVLMSEACIGDPNAFAAYTAQYPLDCLKITPSHLNALLAVDHPERILPRHRLVIGGEAASWDLVARVRQWAPHCRIFNHYGPTETTVGVLTCELTLLAARAYAAPPLGRPIHNTQVYLLDRHQQPVPQGLPGELCVGGANVTRGYINRPDLTDERFIANPFGAGKLYRTGDLARYLPDGQLEFLGRIDQQVKIRGFRVEPGEIESVLATHPAVQQALVLALTTEKNDHYLVAYVATGSEPSASITPALLRDYVRHKLPEYMVPAFLVLLDVFPLTSNGKIDRRALPKPQQQVQHGLTAQHVPPQTLQEEILAEIWSTVLKRDPIGIYDNFFEIGGDSMLSILLLAKAKKAGLEFSLQQLFQHKNIHALAQVIGKEQGPLPLATSPFSLITPADRRRIDAIDADIEDAYPLSAVQMAMLFYSQYRPESAVYHNVNITRLRMPFAAQAWQFAIEALMATHPMLRTSFHLEGYAEPLQLVHRTVATPLAMTDLRHLSTAAQEEALAIHFDREKRLRFDWTAPAQIRFHVHRLDDNLCSLTVANHHVITDGWSSAMLFAELFQHYFAWLDGALGAPAAPLALTYRDFVALERRTIQDATNQQYWEQQLSDAAILQLPRWPLAYRRQMETEATTASNAATDGSPALKAGILDVQFAAELAHGVKALAKALQTPIKSVLLAAHVRVLAFLANQTDVLTGVTVHGRPEEEGADRVVGIFLNVLPFRLALAGGSWQALVQQVFAQEWEILPFRRYPLAEIQRRTGGQPLFETGFNFVNFHNLQGIATLDRLEILEEQDFAQNEQTLLTNFGVDALSGHMLMRLTYNPTELCHAQVVAIRDYYLRTLEAMVRQPTADYTAFSLLSDQEREQMLVAWNSRTADYPKTLLVHHLIEQQATRRPDAIAVVLDANEGAPLTLTYRELNQRANQLAHHLQALGVGADQLVGICLEQSVQMVVAVLGVLKAGGAYVPLDATYPEDRLAYMIENADAAVIITQPSLVKQLPVLAGVAGAPRTLVYLDTNEALNQLPTTPPANRATSANLAYTIYTSGSTGQPKGVMIAHGNWLNSYRMWEDAYQLDKSTSLLQTASFSFDVFPAEFVRALCSGAKLVICPRAWLLDGEKVLNLMRKQQVDGVEFIPPVLRNFAQYLERTGQQADFLKWVVTGGDTWYMEEYWRWREVLGPQTRLLNTYGMTEVACDSSYFETADRVTFAESTITPVGRPFNNVSHYILDKWLQPVPIGTPGEIYIGGAGVMQGYINRPDLTAATLVANPFRPGEMLCRTGDVGRYLPDGNAEFVGRADNQVKLRNFRIELGEIESALSEHPAVRSAIVIVHEDRPGRKTLVAYVAAGSADAGQAAGRVNGKASPTAWAEGEQEQRVTAALLRQHLQDKLPDYMIPSAFVVLDQLPLTPNGKLNRRALPAPDLSDLGLDTVYTPPQTETEVLLVAIWQEVLGVARVGIQDNFFAMGGHSLLAMQIASRIRSALKVDLPLRPLLEHATVHGLADYIDDLRLGQQLQQGKSVSQFRNSDMLPDEEEMELVL
ncbi:MAG: amino acid adenylation domain-containing protein [Caldilineaceae bacterium]